MSKLLKGRPVAAMLLDKAAKITAELATAPQVAFVRVGDDAASLGYQRSAEKVLQQVGIKSRSVVLDQQIAPADFKDELIRLNNDEQVTAILVLEPLPSSLPVKEVQDLIAPEKDIDGATRINLGRTVSPRATDLVPLTAAAVFELLDFYKVNVQGARVTLVGDSLTVGRPLANLLLARNATLTVCDKLTTDLTTLTHQAELVVMATGQPGLLTDDMVQENAVVVDVGINYGENGKLVGDVDFTPVADKVAAITPVPGGVGAITTALLVYRAASIAAASQR